MLCSAIVRPNDLTGSDWNPTMNDSPDEQPDRQLLFLQEMIDENATIAGDVAEIDTHAPYPRGPAYRTSPMYNQHAREVSAALEQSMGHDG